MEPIPESVRADDWYGPFLLDDEDALPQLRDLGRQVVEVVPDCVGLSLSMCEHEVTFTVASSSAEVRMLDAVQYADRGPCLAAVDAGSVLSWADEGAEQRWHAFSMASAASGVASTLSLPIIRDDVVVGGFNLYAAARDSFAGHHQELADLLGAWAGGATTNADLGFTTRDLARQAPHRLHDRHRLAMATGLLARVTRWDDETAEERLRHAAQQAVVPLPELVESIIAMLSGRRGS